MTDEEALNIALAMSPVHRRIMKLCSKSKSWRYRGLAEKLSLDYEDVQSFGQYLQKKKMAHVSPVRTGQYFDGSAIFLNDSGDHVRTAIEVIERRLSHAPNN